MDRITRTANIIKAYYAYKKYSDSAAFVKEVCGFFDFIKNEPISESDMNLLMFLANEVGVPQYFDLFKDKFTDCRISEENINVLSMGAIVHDSSLFRGSTKLHRYQKDIIDRFINGQNNRFVLTAPTSFGKTFLAYEIIHKMQYQNVLLIFPTISLLSENYSRLCWLDYFCDYKIHSLSEEEFEYTEKNIFIFTPERFLSFMDVHQHLHFDFAFIDEVYKIDNSFIIDLETSGENERDTAYRLALEYICNLADDMLLAGPYMALPQSHTLQHRSFLNFAEDNGFSFLLYNQFEIVSKGYTTVKSKHKYFIDEIPVEIGSINKGRKISNLIKALSTPKENTIIYCKTKAATESYARFLLEDQSLISSFQETCSVIESSTYEIFLNHLEHTFGDDWIVLKALKGRIGIHHGLIPKYIQKEIINLFNTGALLCLFSTTTITEGINTSAKNIIITSSKKGNKPLRQFDAKNIAGRAGRFCQHYFGRVIDLGNGFEEIVNEKPEILEHKNYDVQAPKTDVDYQITKEKYLSESERQEKENISLQVVASEIPSEIFNCFRVVGPKDKLFLLSSISNMSSSTIRDVKNLARDLARSRAHYFNMESFQHIIDIIHPIVKDAKLKQLIEKRIGTNEYSLITHLLYHYLQDGFLGMVNYYIHRDNHSETKDSAIRKVADYVYNIFKYYLVKYLGVFDLLFRYHVSVLEKTEFEEVNGLGLLLHKLEYNALNSNVCKISDYGVPFRLIDYYDNEKKGDKSSFDSYEQYIDQKITKLFNLE